ncbi:MAG: Gfo/Idh/MocA family oxidoreductase [Kiritimatiellae bacterium]|nr:Gfo/Idh/MocA family oxidoreductase [Kiritimatiellia bacterium]
MSKTVRWGVIGAGGIADRRTIPEGIVPARNAELALLMDANVSVKAALEEKYKVPFVGTVDDLLAGDVDAVYIATPTFLHEEQATAAAAAGKHVLCEKPLARDSASARRILAACRQAGVKVSIGYMMRFNGYHRKFKQMLDAGEVGTPVMGRAQLTCWFPAMAGNWRQIREKGGGGAMADMATHCFDLLEMFFGRAQEVCAMTGTRVHRYEDPSVEDTAVVMLRFANGAVGLVDAHFNIPDESSEYVLELYGSKGCIKAAFTVCQNSGGSVRACLLKQTGGYDAQQASNTAGYEELKLDGLANIYQSEIEAFSQAVLDDTEPPVAAEDGLWGLNVLEAAYESARTGKVVKLKG